MRIAVIGGKLQGLEAVYLAGKAGWEIILIDKDRDVPASELAHCFHCLNAASLENLIPTLDGCDLIIPALEDMGVFKVLLELSRLLKIPVALDMAAYEITSSKSVSDRLFGELNIPSPKPWPQCSFPIIVKPSGSSGSEGVLKIDNQEGYEVFKKENKPEPDQWVTQEYVEGPSYSIEVIGHQGSYYPLQVTGLEMDDLYDCKRVYAPVELNTRQLKQFSDIAIAIAKEISLNGIMDVEVILHQGQLKVLEIDARFPSQTPTVVYHSTGINMLELFADVYLEKMDNKISLPAFEKAVIFEHVVVNPDSISIAGEHIIGSAGPLKYIENFFGADEALTNYYPGKENWVATLIYKADSLESVHEKKDNAIRSLMSAFNIKRYNDPVPEPERFNMRGN